MAVKTPFNPLGIGKNVPVVSVEKVGTTRLTWMYSNDNNQLSYRNGIYALGNTSQNNGGGTIYLSNDLITWSEWGSSHECMFWQGTDYMYGSYAISVFNPSKFDIIRSTLAAPSTKTTVASHSVNYSGTTSRYFKPIIQCGASQAICNFGLPGSSGITAFNARMNNSAWTINTGAFYNESGDRNCYLGPSIGNIHYAGATCRTLNSAFAATTYNITLDGVAASLANNGNYWNAGGTIYALINYKLCKSTNGYTFTSLSDAISNKIISTSGSPTQSPIRTLTIGGETYIGWMYQGYLYLFKISTKELKKFKLKMPDTNAAYIFVGFDTQSGNICLINRADMFCVTPYAPLLW